MRAAVCTVVCGVGGLLLSLSPAGATGAKRLQEVRSWGYQLQGTGGRPINLKRVGNSSVDLLVIDYASNGRELNAAEVSQLKRRRRSGDRLVLAYLSIGEAEEYRFYWEKEWSTKPPPFLTEVNPEWPGNFKVRYWSPVWQKVLFGVRDGAGKSYLDRILDAGFDGVYLDIVDAYEYFMDQVQPEERRPSAAREMASLVVSLADYARKVRGASNFIVVPQNGSGILEHLTQAETDAYLSAISGIAVEDVFFHGPRKEDNPFHPQKDTLRHLEAFQAAGKVVLAVDYLKSPAKAEKFVRLARARGFVPYVGHRALDQLVSQPPDIASTPEQ